MSAGKGVILAFLGRGEGTQSVQVAVGGKLFAPSRQYLMSAGLMTHVPYDTVVGGIEYIVQSNGEFHHTQAAGKMAGIVSQFRYDGLSQFIAYLWQFLHWQQSQICRQRQA